MLCEKKILMLCAYFLLNVIPFGNISCVQGFVTFELTDLLYCIFPARSKKVKVIDEETSNSWKHLIENPKEWLDHRGNKANGLVNTL